MGLELRLLDTQGNQVKPLPDVESLTLSPILCDSGTLEFSYPAGGRNFDAIKGQAKFGLAVYIDGEHQGELDAQIVDTDGDDVDADSVWKFTGFFNNGLLSQAKTYPANWPLYDPLLPNLVFTDATAGQIVRTLMQQAQARGALVGVDWSTFSNSTDSNGQAWTQIISLEYAPGVVYLDVLKNLYDLGMLEFQMVGLSLRLYVPGTLSEDLTTGATPLVFRKGRDLSDSPRKRSARDVGSVTLAAGADGLYVEHSDPEAVAKWGRIEQVVSQGNITDEGTLRAYAELTTEQAAEAKMEKTHGLVFTDPNTPKPLRNFNLGDWAYSDMGSGVERLRIKQWVLKLEADGSLTGSVTLNDFFAEREAALASRVDGIIGGTTITGGSRAGNLVPDDQVDRMAPKRPTGLTLSSDAYLDTAGATVAQITATWAPVKTNADDTAADDLDHYTVRWRTPYDFTNPPTPVIPEIVIAAQAVKAQLDNGNRVYEDFSYTGAPTAVQNQNDALADAFYASVPGFNWPGDQLIVRNWLAAFITENTPTDPTPLEGWHTQEGTAAPYLQWSPVVADTQVSVQVRAVDRAGNVSLWSDVRSILSASDDTPPPIPSTPLGDNYLGLVRLRWDGTFQNGAAKPIDFLRVVMYASADASVPITAANRVGSLATAGSVFLDVPYGETRYARLVSEDYSGNTSNASPVTGEISPEKVVSDDIFDGAVGSAKLADLAVITAKIADLAVNDAKIGSLNVGKLVTGVLNAQVTLSGRIATAMAGRRVEMNGAAFQGYDADENLTINLDGLNNLMTGRYRTALTGRRIEFGLASSQIGRVEFYSPSGLVSEVAAFTSTAGREVIQTRVRSVNTNSYWNAVAIGDDDRISVTSGVITMDFGGEDPATTTKALIFRRAITARTLGNALVTRDRLKFGLADSEISIEEGGAFRVRRFQSGGSTTDTKNMYAIQGDGEHDWYTGPAETRGWMSLVAGGNTDSPRLMLVTPLGTALGWKVSHRTSDNVDLMQVRNTDDGGFGYAQALNWDVMSDESLKDDIRPIEGSAHADLAQQFLDVTPKSYTIKSQSVMTRVDKKPKKVKAPRHVGLVAQEAPAFMVSGEDGEKAISLYQFITGVLILAQHLDQRLKKIEKGQQHDDA